jgi:membrane-bound lytic murein transglycosylase D
MGGNLFRRKTLTALLLLTVSAWMVPAGEDSSEPPTVPAPAVRRTAAVSIDMPESGYLEPVQTHIGPKTASIAIPSHPRVTAEIKRLKTPGSLKWLDACLERSLPYRAFIMEKIREHRVPEELLYLPVIESAYVVGAVSRSGAAGLWQFMTNSIAPFGMSVNDWVDDRFDFWKSTDASLRKLQENYRYFNDWYLALAAYNCGLGALSRIVRNTGISDYWKLLDGGHLPPETANYVPKFLAVVSVASVSGRHGLNGSWEHSPGWERIFLERQVDLSLLAERSGVPIESLKAGNAELRYGVTPPERYALKVPTMYADAIRKVLSDRDRQLLNFYLHTVGSGDTLYELSRHFGVSVQLILEYNPKVRPEALRIGTQLLVPTIKKAEPYVKRIDIEELKSFTAIHAVKPGETLWSISKRYGTTPEKLAAANDIDLDGIIRVGMTLNVPENRPMMEER